MNHHDLDADIEPQVRRLPERALWAAVLVRAYYDMWDTDSARNRAAAVEWISDESGLFPELCHLFDFDPDKVREAFLRAPTSLKVGSRVKRTEHELCEIRASHARTRGSVAIPGQVPTGAAPILAGLTGLKSTSAQGAHHG